MRYRIQGTCHADTMPRIATELRDFIAHTGSLRLCYLNLHGVAAQTIDVRDEAAAFFAETLLPKIGAAGSFVEQHTPLRTPKAFSRVVTLTPLTATRLPNLTEWSGVWGEVVYGPHHTLVRLRYRAEDANRLADLERQGWRVQRGPVALLAGMGVGKAGMIDPHWWPMQADAEVPSAERASESPAAPSPDTAPLPSPLTMAEIVAGGGAPHWHVGVTPTGQALCVAWRAMTLAIHAGDERQGAVIAALLARALAEGMGGIVVAERATLLPRMLAPFVNRLRIMDMADPWESARIPWRHLPSEALAELVGGTIPSPLPATLSEILRTAGRADAATPVVDALTREPSYDLAGTLDAGGGVVLLYEPGAAASVLAALLILSISAAPLTRPLLICRPAALTIPPRLASRAVQVVNGDVPSATLHLHAIPDGWDVRFPDGNHITLQADLAAPAVAAAGADHAALVGGLQGRGWTDQAAHGDASLVSEVTGGGPAEHDTAASDLIGWPDENEADPPHGDAANVLTVSEVTGGGPAEHDTAASDLIGWPDEAEADPPRRDAADALTLSVGWPDEAEAEADTLTVSEVTRGGPAEHDTAASDLMGWPDEAEADPPYEDAADALALTGGWLDADMETEAEAEADADALTVSEVTRGTWEAPEDAGLRQQDAADVPHDERMSQSEWDEDWPADLTAFDEGMGPQDAPDVPDDERESQDGWEAVRASQDGWDAPEDAPADAGVRHQDAVDRPDDERESRGGWEAVRASQDGWDAPEDTPEDAGLRHQDAADRPDAGTNGDGPTDRTASDGDMWHQDAADRPDAGANVGAWPADLMASDADTDLMALDGDGGHQDAVDRPDADADVGEWPADLMASDAGVDGDGPADGDMWHQDAADRPDDDRASRGGWDAVRASQDGWDAPEDAGVRQQDAADRPDADADGDGPADVMDSDGGVPNQDASEGDTDVSAPSRTWRGGRRRHRAFASLPAVPPLQGADVGTWPADRTASDGGMGHQDAADWPDAGADVGEWPADLMASDEGVGPQDAPDRPIVAGGDRTASDGDGGHQDAADWPDAGADVGAWPADLMASDGDGEPQDASEGDADGDGPADGDRGHQDAADWPDDERVIGDGGDTPEEGDADAGMRHQDAVDRPDDEIADLVAAWHRGESMSTLAAELRRRRPSVSLLDAMHILKGAIHTPSPAHGDMDAVLRGMAGETPTLPAAHDVLHAWHGGGQRRDVVRAVAAAHGMREADVRAIYDHVILPRVIADLNGDAKGVIRVLCDPHADSATVPSLVVTCLSRFLGTPVSRGALRLILPTVRDTLAAWETAGSHP